MKERFSLCAHGSFLASPTAVLVRTGVREQECANVCVSSTNATKRRVLAAVGRCGGARPSPHISPARARCACRAAARGSGSGTSLPGSSVRTRPRRSGPCGRAGAVRLPASLKAQHSPRPICTHERIVSAQAMHSVWGGRGRDLDSTGNACAHTLTAQCWPAPPAAP